MDSTLTTQLVTWINAGHTAFYLHSGEDDRVDTLLKSVSKETSFQVREWNLAWGWVDFENRHPLTASSYSVPPQADQMLAGLLDDDLENTILVFRNIRTVMDSSPLVTARLQQLLLRIRRHHSSECCVVCVDDRVDIPSLIEPLITLVELPLPRRDAIRVQAEQFAKDHGVTVSDTLLNRISTTLTGLTAIQINQSLAVALEKYGELNEKALLVLLQEKEQVIAKSGVLEMVKVKEHLEDIGGLENLKKWLERKASILQRLAEAEEAGLQAPKGVLVAGMPGCGKSLTAKAVANLFGLPLLRLDIGSLLGKYVGESEHNMRRALAMAETISPCVLWVDELEKAFVGIGSSNASEVTSRLLGYFLTWMQEKTGAVFVVATANNVSALPPELLRKGRFDDVFYVGFPYLAERKAILRIHLKSVWQTFTAEQQQQLAVMCRNFAGADIQNAVNDARESAFLAGGDIDYSHLSHALMHTVPLRETLREQVSQYESLFEKMKLKAASVIDGLSLAQMIALADDTNPLERLRVAKAEECSEDLLEKLAKDDHPDVRKEVYRNPYCTARILSACIAPAENSEITDKDSLSHACLHRNAPTNLLLKLIQKNRLSEDILLQLVEVPHCAENVLRELLSRKNDILRQAVLRHANCPEDLREEYLYEQNDSLRAALALNPALSAEQQLVLVRDKKSAVRIALAKNNALTAEVKCLLAQDSDSAVIDAFEDGQKQSNPAGPSLVESPDDSALLTQLDRGDVQTLLTIAEKRTLPVMVQRRFAQKVTNEAALATLAMNLKLTEEVQQILATEGNTAVRDVLAGNRMLAPAVQLYLYENGLQSTRQSLMKNPALCTEVQQKAVEDRDSEVLELMAQNNVISEQMCNFLLSLDDKKINESLAGNTNISPEIQKTLCSELYNLFVFKSYENVRNQLAKNESICKDVFNDLLLEPQYYDYLLCNPSIGRFDFGKIEEYLNTKSISWVGRAPAYMYNAGLPERLQAVIVKNLSSNEKLLAPIASNTGLVPSQQTMLTQYSNLDILLNLIKNPASTPRTIDVATQKIRNDGDLNRKLRTLIKTKTNTFESKKSTLATTHEVSDSGLIKNILTVSHLEHNKTVSLRKAQLDWLCHVAKSIE